MAKNSGTKHVGCWKESHELLGPSPYDHLQASHIAFSAVDAHLEIVIATANGDLTQGSEALQLHVRYFFWELIAAWEFFHNWVNVHYDLGLSPDKAVPHLVRKEMRSKQRCTTAYNILDNAAKSSWLFEVQKYRNYAHRSFHQIQGMGSADSLDDSVFFLPPAREGQAFITIKDQLKFYRNKIMEIGIQLTNLRDAEAA